MEDFSKLLDDYLDFEGIEYEDEIEEKKKNSTTRVESPFTDEDAISIDRFVNAFLGYQTDCSNLYHSGLRDLELDFVIGVDNNFANKNPEYVKRGYLLIVIDARNNRGTYLNPVYIQKYLNKEDILRTYYKFSRMKNIELDKLEYYYAKFLEAQRAYEELERFITILRETNKENKVRKLERRNKNDKY